MLPSSAMTPARSSPTLTHAAEVVATGWRRPTCGHGHGEADQRLETTHGFLPYYRAIASNQRCAHTRELSCVLKGGAIGRDGLGPSLFGPLPRKHGARTEETCLVAAPRGAAH